MTNGTVIRYMDNAHLAQIILCPYAKQNCGKGKEECRECKLAWLQEEAEYGRLSDWMFNGFVGSDSAGAAK